MWGRTNPPSTDPLLAELGHVCEGLRALAQANALLAETIGALTTRLKRVDGRLDALERWADDNAEALHAAGLAPYPTDRSRHMGAPRR